jgi:phosphoadenosine phosphosulfate reductase
MGTAEIQHQVNVKLNEVRATLAREIAGRKDVCVTCSFQAEDVLLTKLAQEQDAKIPVLFLDTGYHFAETYTYRRRPSTEFFIDRLPTSAAGCARWNRCSRPLRSMAFG